MAHDLGAWPWDVPACVGRTLCTTDMDVIPVHHEGNILFTVRIHVSMIHVHIRIAMNGSRFVIDLAMVHGYEPLYAKRFAQAMG